MAIGRILLSGLGAIAACVLATMPLQAQTMASLGPNEQALAGPTFLEQTTTPRPTEPIKRAAFDVLDTHCSRCHQTDRLINRSKPAKGFGNILDLDALAANPKYVKPGDADRSLIVHVVVRREMPSDVFQDGDLDHPTPDDNDLKALRAWIGGMSKEPTETPVASARPALGAKVAPLQLASLPHAEEHVQIGPSANATADVSLPSQAPPLTAVEMVVEAQKNLRRLGCFTGEADGVRDNKTDAALDLYNSRLGRKQHVASLTPELLEEMGDQSGKICRMTCPVGERYEQGACVGSEPAIKGPDETGSDPAQPTRRAHVTPRPQRPAIVEQSSRDRTANHAPKSRPAPAQAERQLAVPHRLARTAPPAPTVRQAQRAPRSFGGGGGGSSAQDTISGVNGI